ncbi:iron-sulfur cluster-binding protein [Vibrio variabilis]|uniref:Iron-sulfur cluster-binding protein n=1 Tax=Vibrio variabilis TaxID=990271 RepID=A0ABQ0J9V5_9VIBR|nr:iron-sulfur cluster-binding protein [Vibrio variabilis]
MITMLQDKLRGHSHFDNEAALRRIAMCEDCRVVDMFENMAENQNSNSSIRNVCQWKTRTTNYEVTSTCLFQLCAVEP